MSRDPGPGIRSEHNAVFFGAQPQHVVSALAQQRMERQAFRPQGGHMTESHVNVNPAWNREKLVNNRKP